MKTWEEEKEHIYKVKVSFEAEISVYGEMANEELRECLDECLVDDAPDYLANADIKIEKIK